MQGLVLTSLYVFLSDAKTREVKLKVQTSHITLLNVQGREVKMLSENASN